MSPITKHVTENLDAPCRPAPPNILNVSKCDETKALDRIDNRLTPPATTQLLPSPPYPKDWNDQLSYTTPLKISVKKATKYLGLSKSLGIKVCGYIRYSVPSGTVTFLLSK